MSEQNRSLAIIYPHFQRQSGQHRAHQPALSLLPAEPTGKKAGDTSGGEDNPPVDQHTDNDLTETECQRLPQHMPLRRVDKLRQQGQIDNGSFWVEQIGKQPHAEQLASAVRRQVAQLKRGFSTTYRLPRHPQQINHASETQHVVSHWYRHQQRGNAQRSAAQRRAYKT
ncbi:hypothetical protein EPYR_02948 [Erwinia pyrifoliae DSM 12163]|nr:hypothetical protein EPYR_02948 [Erwinia pyrifoliae DSM 12163]